MDIKIRINHYISVTGVSAGPGYSIKCLPGLSNVNASLVMYLLVPGTAVIPDDMKTVTPVHIGCRTVGISIVPSQSI